MEIPKNQSLFLVTPTLNESRPSRRPPPLCPPSFLVTILPLASSFCLLLLPLGGGCHYNSDSSTEATWARARCHPRGNRLRMLRSAKRALQLSPCNALPSMWTTSLTTPLMIPEVLPTRMLRPNWLPSTNELGSLRS